MRVALLLCPSWDFGYAVSGLALLSARLRGAGHEPSLLDLNMELALVERAAGGREPWVGATPADMWTDPEAVRLRAFEPYRGLLESRIRAELDAGCRLFGFAVYASNAAHTLQTAALIKRLEPAAWVALGGPGCLTRRECVELLRHECVDAVFCGEADLSFPRFVDALDRAGRPAAAPGVYLREDPATWTTDAPLVERLDELPHADFEGFRHLRHYRGKTLHTTRGCIRRCNFCADWREMPFRTMSGERIFAEAVHQLSRQPDQRAFVFGDSVLNASLPDLSDFCRRAVDARLPMTWGGYAIARPDLDEPTLSLMSRAGCGELYFGIESGSERVLKDMHKSVPPSVNAQSLRRARAQGIHTFATWIVGFPSETEADFQESLAFVRQNAAHISLLTPSLFSVAELKSQPGPFGLSPEDDDLYWASSDGANTFPVRVGRLVRLMEAASDCGVRARYQGKLDLAQTRAYAQAVLESYARRGRP